MTTQTPQSVGASGPGTEPTLAGSEGGASTRERARHVGGAAKEEAAGVAQEAKHQARDLVDEARSQVRQQVDTQRSRLSDLLREISEELEDMAERSDRNGIGSELARQVAGRARDARGYLDGGGDIVEDVRRFARRRPGTFLVGAIAAGVFAGRATKAAASARRQQQAEEREHRLTGASGAGYPGEYRDYGTTTSPGSTYTSPGSTYTEGSYPAGAPGAAGTPSAAPASGYGSAPAATPYRAAPGSTYESGSTYETGAETSSGYGTGTSGAQAGPTTAETPPRDEQER